MSHCHNRSSRGNGDINGHRLQPEMLTWWGPTQTAIVGGGCLASTTRKLDAMHMANSSLSADIQRASLERDIMQRDAAEDRFLQHPVV